MKRTTIKKSELKGMFRILPYQTWRLGVFICLPLLPLVCIGQTRTLKSAFMEWLEVLTAKVEDE